MPCRQRVQNDGEYSKPLPMTNEVNHGSFMAPTLFWQMFSAMLTDDFQCCDAGFPLIANYSTCTV